MLKKWIKIPSEYNQKIKDLKIRELLSIKISDQDICVVIVDNELFAFSNYCPHGGALLSLGTCTQDGESPCIAYITNIVCLNNDRRYNNCIDH